MNYIRYWQADGESEKTSMRTSNSLGILASEGCFTGGTVAYGYRNVRKGRTNKHRQEVTDLEVVEEEAYVVQTMFRLAAVEGYGAQRLANYLNSNGFKNRSGKNWHPATIQSMLRNVLYIGIIRSGTSRSPAIEDLRIVDDKTFETVQAMLESRSRKNEAIRSTPLNTRGDSLLAGNVFCGHCGARLCITTSGQGRPRKDGTDSRRIRYTCQTKSRTHGDCDGQTGYTVQKLDRDIEIIVLSILNRVRKLSRTEVMALCFDHDTKNKKAFVKKAEKDLVQAEAAITRLQEEVAKAMFGQSEFSPQILNNTIKAQEQRCEELREALNTAKNELAADEAKLMEIGGLYNDMLDWAFAYDKASNAAKKVIISHLIERVDVYRGYKLKIKFRIGIEQFLLSVAAIA